MDFASALRRAQGWVGRIAGVERVAEGVYDGKPCITVFVSSSEPRRVLPALLGEWRVVQQGAGNAADG
jgi:hypothetical protein